MLKQFVKLVLGTLVIALVFQVMSLSVFAQSPLPPPLSPWLGLTDRNRSGAFGNPYLDVVRPQLERQQAFAAQANQIQAQQRALQAMQGAASGGVDGTGGNTGTRDLMGTGGRASAPGGATNNMLLAPPREIPSTQRNPAGFNQYLHYYPSHAMQRQPVPNFSSTGRRR